MKVFKTKASNDTYSISLTEENYQEATKLLPPYVQECSYFAVCPECNNPVQIVGLFCENRDVELFAKHLSSKNIKLEKIAIYNENNKKNCKYFTGRKCDNPFEHVIKGDLEKTLCKVMRDNFDKVVYHWEVLTGIKLSNVKARAYLRDWIEWKTFRCTYCTSSTLSVSLKCARELTNLIGIWVKCDSPLFIYISQDLEGLFYLEDTNSPKWKKIQRNGKYASLDFNFLPYYNRTTSKNGSIERMTMQVLSRYGDQVERKEINLNIESGYWDNILNMKSWIPNENLLQIAKEEFRGMDLES